MDERATGLNHTATIDSELNEDASVEEIRADIEHTRAEMSETIEAIQEKLSPEHIKERVQAKVHDATIGKVQHLADAAREKFGAIGPKTDSDSSPADFGNAPSAPASALSAKGQAALAAIRRNPLPIVLAIAGALTASFVMLRRDGRPWYR